jgi:hypothetical protein
LPAVFAYLDPGEIEFLDKEVFTKLQLGKKHSGDLVAKVKFKGRAAYFLIHAEPESSRRRKRGEFGRRMFNYFALFTREYRLPVYPVAILSYDKPRNPEDDMFRVATFVDTYLSLSAGEEAKVVAEIEKLPPKERKATMEIIMTSWEKKGFEQGLRLGEERGRRKVVLRQLARQIGTLSKRLQTTIERLPSEQIERLAEALVLYEFHQPRDVTRWLREHTVVMGKTK